MDNPSHHQGPPAPPKRSRTRRDPSEDQVYRVPPEDFAHTVQRLTGPAASPAATRPASSPPRQPALSVSTPASSVSTPASSVPTPALSVSTPASRSMQEAYLAWCASNNVPLSPGTMAEMERHGGSSQFRD